MTMPRKGAPAVELAVENTLKLYLNAALDGVWAAWASQDAADAAAGFNVPPAGVYPALYVRGNRTLSELNQAMPVVLTTCPSSKVEDAITGWTAWEHEVDIYVQCALADERALDAMVARYEVAIWEVFATGAHAQLDGSLVGCVGAYVIGRGRATAMKQSTRFVQVAAVGLVVRMDESV